MSDKVSYRTEDEMDLSKCLSWPGKMTTQRAEHYLLTAGFVAVELYDAEIERLKAENVELRRQLTEAYERVAKMADEWAQTEIAAGTDKGYAQIMEVFAEEVRSLIPPKGSINIPPLYDLNAIAKSHRKGDHR